MKPVNDIEGYYIPVRDKELPPEQQTRFRLRNLTVQEWREINNAEGIGARIVISLMYGLKGWDNFDAKFETSDGLASLDSIGHIPEGVRIELSNAILTRNILTEEEVKN